MTSASPAPEWSTDEQSAMARRLVRRIDSGILSTLSVDVPGYPFGSVTPYVLTHAGEVAIYVSGIAQHTANMLVDPRVCLTVTAGASAGGGNVQAKGRVTIVGDARRAEDAEGQAALDRYLALFPEAQAYAGTHDFAIYLIRAKRVRHIAGFGQIFWVEPEAWSVPEPAWAEQEAGILEHMNRDHVPALRAMAEAQGSSGDDLRLLALDPEGFHLGVDGTRLYLPFPEPCLDASQVREALVALTQAARAAQPGG